ncbi:MAG: hypothetical protein J6332_05490 [Abditibacteriota bacterium]|nr:hypothetical protein [Abditibacteriota bacterium]
MNKSFVTGTLLLALLLAGCGGEISRSFFDKAPQGRTGRVWTVAGNMDGELEAFVGPGGEVQPGSESYTAYFIVADPEAKKIITPADSLKDCKRKLAEGCLPAPVAEWEKDKVLFSATTFAGYDEDFLVSAVDVKNMGDEDRTLDLYAVIAPNRVIGGYSAPTYIELEGGNINTGGKLFLRCVTKPDEFASYISQDPKKDVTCFIPSGKIPDSKGEAGKDCTVSAAARYKLTLKSGEKKTFYFTTSPDKIDYKKVYGDFAAKWQKKLFETEIDIPDENARNCYYANLAYMLIMSDGGVCKPGTAYYDAFWVRDFAYFADAFYYTRNMNLVESGLAYLDDLRLENGGYAPKTGSTEDTELDAPGQVLYAMAQYYRRTGHRDFLSSVDAAVYGACDYIIDKIKSDKRGIMPPSVSAEDIGSGSDHHYWDDFWAVRGLLEGAYLAGEAGNRSRASRYAAEGLKLFETFTAQVHELAEKEGIEYIPNGPEDIKTSSSARGTSCGLWPCDVLDTEDFLVQTSFDYYWSNHFKNGGFIHRDHYWPYAGLDMAVGWLMTDEYYRAQTVLDWTLGNDPTKGWWSYPEGMNLKDNTLAEGDMPHGWFSASYISFVRNSLVRESDDTLMLLSGVKDEWTEKGLYFGNLPTLFGNVRCRVITDRDILIISDIALTERTKKRFEGYRIKLAPGIVATLTELNGRKPARMLYDMNEIELPPDTRSAKIKIGSTQNNEAYKYMQKQNSQSDDNPMRP